jgi:hypothetical protein
VVAVGPFSRIPGFMSPFAPSLANSSASPETILLATYLSWGHSGLPEFGSNAMFQLPVR